MSNHPYWNTTTVNSCCYECKERFPACHDVCATYLKAKAEREEKMRVIKEAKAKQKRIDSFHYDQVLKRKKERESKGKRY